MSDAFAPPPGDPDALAATARALGAVAADLDAQYRSTQHAVAEAITQWRGPRTEAFRRAGAGLQAELLAASTGIAVVAQALRVYAIALRTAQQEIAGYARHAATATAAAADRTQTGIGGPAGQHLDQLSLKFTIGPLDVAAGTARSQLAVAAARVAAVIDAETDVIVPNAAMLSASEIERRVDATLGLSGLTEAGPMSVQQAWTTLGIAQSAVPENAVTESGEPDWSAALAEFNDKYLAPLSSLGTVAGAPNAGWAFARLVQASAAKNQFIQDARGAYLLTVGQLDHLVGVGEITARQANEAKSAAQAVLFQTSYFGPATRWTNARRFVAAGGLPETTPFLIFGRGLGLIGFAGDLATIYDPGVDNANEGAGLRVLSGANAVGTVMAIAPETSGAVISAGAAVFGTELATVGWVPVAGQVIVVGTGLVLAGDYAYHHWDAISDFTTTTAPHALATAASATGHALGDGCKAVGQAFSHVF